MSDFSQRVHVALEDDHLQTALKQATELLGDRRRIALEALPEADGIRDRARSSKLAVLANLEPALEAFSRKLRSNGAEVHWAVDARAANELVVRLAKSRGVKKIVKSKSMVTEEIHLNPALEQAGLNVVETDLGEYIVQLSGDQPSHIIAPIIHKTRGDVGRVMQEALEVPYSDNPETLTRYAREKLREEFLNADMGITGANFGVIETGTICLVTNEGNGRMVSSLPRIHVVLMGIEKLVQSMADLDCFLRLLARSATGQSLSVYTTLIQGPRAPGEEGPEELHVVLLDNGRSDILGSDLAESLACIRCGACLNICPVYKSIGGHAYGDTYAGPIGSIVTPGLRGLAEWHELPGASSICGACREVCPVRIDIPKMLLRLRRNTREEVRGSRVRRWAMAAYAWIAVRSRLYRILSSVGRWLLRRQARDDWITRSKIIPAGWLLARDLRGPARRSFQDQWRSGEEGA